MKTCETHGLDNAVVARTSRRTPDGGELAWLVCEVCEIVLGRAKLCGQPTKKRGACRIAIREDWGHTTCSVHR